ncbi:thiamine phosphate synthase [Pseudochrobactrum saccharolyticum]|uniref:thiamine phosphate synthase n=1 Tax=Pseudochrobactrum saccharolyticum TaxID=354352 RepID=UPI002753A5DC|nr:thiamine phosphate synthase [Pseudochrobactrum saccharolyticum]MDP8250724.1 thiamine phosphate synthase [Pseudochrobactrum saccharolyticum]
MKQFDLSLYLVLDRELCGSLGMVKTAIAAVRGGATMVQLRDKDASQQEMLETAKALKAALEGTNAKLIINDNIDVAIAVGADGLHIGQHDGSPEQVRAKIGADMILGLSVQTAEMATKADSAVVDYLGIGPVFPTATKKNCAPSIGFDGLKRVYSQNGLPAVAIGGIKLPHVEDVLATGIDGLAVVSAICGQESPEQEARAFNAAIAHFRGAKG